MTTVIVKEFCAMFLIHVVLYRVKILIEASHELLVDVAALGFLLDKTIYDFSVGIDPTWIIAPFAVEVLLNHSHLFLYSLLGTMLHACVD